MSNESSETFAVPTTVNSGHQLSPQANGILDSGSLSFAPIDTTAESAGDTQQLEQVKHELQSKTFELQRMREIQVALEQQLAASKKEILRLKWTLGSGALGNVAGDTPGSISPATPVLTGPEQASPSVPFSKRAGSGIGLPSVSPWGPVHRTSPLVSPMSSSHVYRARSISDHTSTLPHERPPLHQSWHNSQDVPVRKLSAVASTGSVEVTGDSNLLNAIGTWGTDAGESQGTWNHPSQQLTANAVMATGVKPDSLTEDKTDATPMEPTVEQEAAIRRCIGDRQLNRLSNSLLSQLLPTEESERLRMRVLEFIKSIVKRSLGAQVYPHGSFALKTYLPHDTMYTSAFFSRGHENSWVQRVVTALCQEANAGDGPGSADDADSSAVRAPSSTAGSSASLETERDTKESTKELADESIAVESVSIVFRAHATPGPLNTSFRTAEVIHRADDAGSRTLCCRVGGTNVCITGNRVGDLSQLGLFEEADRLVDKGHLLKRTILLVKMWAVRCGVLGDDLLSDEAIHALVLAVFNAFHVNIVTPLEGLFEVVRRVATFPWTSSAWHVFGPVNSDGFEDGAALDDYGHMSWPGRHTPSIQPLLSPSMLQRYAATIQQSATSSLGSLAVVAGKSAGADGSKGSVGPLMILAPLEPRRVLTERCSAVNRTYILDVFKRSYRDLCSTCLLWPQQSTADAFLNLVFDSRYLSEFGVQMNGPLPVSSDSFGLSLLSSHSYTTTTEFVSRAQQDIEMPKSEKVATLSSAAPGEAADSLQADLSIIESQLTHARQFQTPDISEEELVSLVGGILSEHGPVPVGRMGSLLHDVTNNHSLPAMIKERYGGLKRFLESHKNVFILGDDHPYNPHVSLKSEFTAGSEPAVSNAPATSAASPNTSKQRKGQRSGGRRRGRNRSGSGSGNAMLGPYQAVKAGTDRPGPLMTTFVAMECSLKPSVAAGTISRVAIVNYSGDKLYEASIGAQSSDTEQESDLETVATHVADLIQGRIVVGHNVSRYIALLGLSHPASMIRDTALYQGLCPRGPVPLHALMKERMGVNVQRAPDVIEDARSALILYKYCRRDWEQYVAQIGSMADFHVPPNGSAANSLELQNTWARGRPFVPAAAALSARSHSGFRPRAYSGQSVPTPAASPGQYANRRSHSHQGPSQQHWQQGTTRYSRT